MWGHTLADALGRPFFDGDDYHFPPSIKKMAAGTPLTDTDRGPWLDRFHDLLAGELTAGRSVILACSALKQSYRQRLAAEIPNLRFVFLRGYVELMRSRLSNRTGHYMPPGLLQSQFDALEEPNNAITLDASLPVETLVSAIRSGMNSDFR